MTWDELVSFCQLFHENISARNGARAIVVLDLDTHKRLINIVKTPKYLGITFVTQHGA